MQELAGPGMVGDMDSVLLPDWLVAGALCKCNCTVSPDFFTSYFIPGNNFAIELMYFIFPAPFFVGASEQHILVLDRKAGFSETLYIALGLNPGRFPADFSSVFA